MAGANDSPSKQRKHTEAYRMIVHRRKVAVQPAMSPHTVTSGRKVIQSAGETQALKEPSAPMPVPHKSDHERHSTKESVSHEKQSPCNDEEAYTFEDHYGGLEEHALAEFVIIPIAIAFMLALFVGGMLEKYEVSWLPESCATILIGVVLGFHMRSHLGHSQFMENEELFNKTCSTLLTLFLLPVLIFESGWALRHKDFASQFQYIMLFAVVGSLISFLVVGSLIYWTGQAGYHSITYPRTAFAYASLIAATDPVATLATYSKLKVDPLLNIMVFGDSVFNDAVAIVLFKVLNDNAIMGTVSSRPSFQEISGKIGWGIFTIFLGSLALGLLIAALFLLLVRFCDLRHSPRLEILALVAVAYATFACGEIVGMSGIIATIFCSMLLGIYARPHLSPAGSLLSNFFLKQCAGVMDTGVFLLTGVCFCMLGARGLLFGAWAGLFCLVGRACSIFPLSAITNAVKRGLGKSKGLQEEDMNLLNPRAQFMMWHAGLRGAIALTLCMSLGSWVDALDGPETRHILTTGTAFVIGVFLLVFGGSTEACLRKLKIPMGEQTEVDKLYRKETHGVAQSIFTRLNERFMIPVFVGDARRAAKIKDTDAGLEVEDVLKSAMKARRVQSHVEST